MGLYGVLLQQCLGLIRRKASEQGLLWLSEHKPCAKISSQFTFAAAAAKSLQSCLTLFDSIDGSPTGSPVHGILQARILEWVAISFSNAWKWKVKVMSLSRVWLLATHGLQPTRLLHPWDFPGKSTGVGWHCLLLTFARELKICFSCSSEHCSQ